MITKIAPPKCLVLSSYFEHCQMATHHGRGHKLSISIICTLAPQMLVHFRRNRWDCCIGSSLYLTWWESSHASAILPYVSALTLLTSADLFRHAKAWKPSSLIQSPGRSSRWCAKQQLRHNSETPVRRTVCNRNHTSKCRPRKPLLTCCPISGAGSHTRIPFGAPFGEQRS